MSGLIRRATVSDIDAIHAIEIQSFSVPWSKESFRSDLENTKVARYLVLEEEGEIIGYAGYWCIVGEGQVTNVAVAPLQRGKGYGLQLVQEMTARAFAEGCTTMFLEVRVSNEAALGVYTKLGYAKVSVRKDYYSEPTEDSYIMNCTPATYTGSYFTDKG